jgi:hypothetical protein
MRKLASPRGNGNAENINSGWKLAWRESIDDHRKLTFLDAAVAGYLSRRWKSGGAIASYAMIAKAVGCTPRGAMNSVARLISVGALKLEKRGNSCRQANEYSLHKLVNETSLTSERNDIELVNETTPLSTGLFPQSSSLGDMKEKEGKKGSGEEARSTESQSPASSFGVIGSSRDTRTTQLNCFPHSERFVPRVKSSSWSRRPSVPAAMSKES